MPTREESGARLIDRLLQAHREKFSGALEYEVAGRPRRVLFDGGEIVLPVESPWAAAVREIGPTIQCASWSDLLRKMSASYLEVGVPAGWRRRPSEDHLPEAVGPVPTEALLRRCFAAADSSPGPGAELVAEPLTRGDSQAALCFSPEEAWTLERLRRAKAIEELERECPFAPEHLRSAISGLLAVGRVHVPSAAPIAPQDSGLLRLVELLSARIAASLRERPLGLLDDALRSRLSKLAAQAEGMSHYELLGVPSNADDEAIQGAFESFARQVHPSHSARPAVGVPAGVLSRLFERGVAALRTLGDPALRAAYDTAHGVERRGADPSSSDRREEVATLARREFERARYEELNGDLHAALSLYEQVVELDRRPEYLLALARLQARNSAWSSRALESCRRALEIDPENVEVRVLSAELYERLGQLERAAALYLSAARARPPHAGAQAGLRRLQAQGVRPAGEREGGGIGRLFRRD